MADEKYEGIPITKLPPGKALGADDLTNWAHRRSKGQFGDRYGEVKAAIMKCQKCDVLADVLIHQPKEWRKHREVCRTCGEPMKFIKFKRAGFKRRGR